MRVGLDNCRKPVEAHSETEVGSQSVNSHGRNPVHNPKIAKDRH